MNNLKEKLERLSGVQAFPAGVSIARGQRSEKLRFSLIGPGIEQVANYSEKLKFELSKNENLGKIDSRRFVKKARR